MKAAFFAYRARQRGENASFSEEELSSCMKNEAPGAPELSIMSFETAFHGRLFGSLSLTRSKAIHKVHYICRPFVKTADCVMSARCSSICKSGRYRSQLNSDFVQKWPAVAWPAVKYPLDENAAHNAQAEKDALANVEATIEEYAKMRPVAALIVEPIQAEGGDNHASPAFFRGLREITKKHGVSVLAFAKYRRCSDQHYVDRSS